MFVGTLLSGKRSMSASHQGANAWCRKTSATVTMAVAGTPAGSFSWGRKYSGHGSSRPWPEKRVADRTVPAAHFCRSGLDDRSAPVARKLESAVGDSSVGRGTRHQVFREVVRVRLQEPTLAGVDGWLSESLRRKLCA